MRTKKSSSRRRIGKKIKPALLQFLLALGIILGIIVLSVPFYTSSELTPEKTAEIETANTHITLLIYALFLTGIATYTLVKKTYRITTLFLAIIFIFLLAVNSSFSDSSDIQDTTQSQEISNPNKRFLITKDSCNIEKTIQEIKYCTPIIKTDIGHGSGIVLKNNFLVTNKHVIENASTINTYFDFEDGTGIQEVPLTLWNYSPILDLAVLKLPEKGFSDCTWFDSSALTPAEDLYVIGYAESSEQESSITKGIFSRMVKWEDGTEYIQTDAPANPGNSGGPIVNQCGVVGIVTRKPYFSKDSRPLEGISFALSSNYINKIIDELIASGKENTPIPATNKYFSYESDPDPSLPIIVSQSDIDALREHLNFLFQAKEFWEQQRGKVNQEKLNILLDSYGRQIAFVNTLLSRFKVGSVATNEDIVMYQAIVKMFQETTIITDEIIEEMQTKRRR